MDAVSYSLASKQAQRIEKFIENPDSTSGIVTVPKTIASGETVTVPAGRVAVLPNVVVDGDLVVEAGGEIFVPAGGTIDYTNGIKVNGESLVMSVPTAYHIYNGNVEATNTVITNGFSTALYTGNGDTQSINTGVDMATQWGDDDSEMFGGLVWRKKRNSAGSSHFCDTVRGATKDIYSDSTSAEVIQVLELQSFNGTGFTLGNYNTNVNAATYASWNFQTTHRRTGVTNHGKAYTEHYNPFTGFTIIKYEGSGLAGHEIPHSLGRKLGFWTIKNISLATDWVAQYRENFAINLNLVNAEVAVSVFGTSNTDTSIAMGNHLQVNASTNQYILYGWANSYFDEDNTLIGNYEVGVYQGTGAAGNKVTTRGKPAWVMVKRLDSTGNWAIFDNMRNLFDSGLLANSSGTDTVVDYINIVDDGIVVQTVNTDTNTTSGQYLYMVVYDNDSGSGKSKYPKATDTTNLAINALVPYANGIDVNGSKVSIEYKNETITGLTLTQGKNYPYSLKDGTYGSNRYQPMYGSLRDRVIAGENPDYFDLKTMKWYETTGGEELVTNGTFDVDTSGWTAVNGATLSIYSNTLSIYNNAPYGNAYQVISTTVGKKYILYVDVSTNIGSSAFIQLETLLGSYDILNYNTTTTGSFKFEFIAKSSTTYLKLQAGSNIGNSASFDNISVFEVEPTIGAEIQPRTYLDCVVYADNNGQVSYVEELPKTQYFDRIETSDNRKVIYLADRGISAIQNNKRYVLDNPFGNENYMDCDVKVEIYYNGKWFEPNWDGNSGTGISAYGVKAGSLLEGIIVQSGALGIKESSAITGSLDGSGAGTVLSAPARVIIQYNGKTGRVK